MQAQIALIIKFFSALAGVFQGDYGQSHKFCAAESVPDFYSYGRTMHLIFKSDAFMAGNGLRVNYQVAGGFWWCQK